MSKINPWIQSVSISKDKPKTKILNVFRNKNKNVTRMLTVPIDAPEIDPYDRETGKGFMTPNAIIKSGLSTNAKLMFSVLRSFISYNLGFVFPNEEQLEEAMSKERKANRKALKELEQCAVIRIVKMQWKGYQKNYYFFEPEEKWNLPEFKQFSYKKNADKNEGEEFDTSQIEGKDNIVLGNSANKQFDASENSEERVDFFEVYGE